MPATDVAGSRREHLTALTSLRFFAALWVLLFHALSGVKDLPPVLAGFVHNGFAGVSLFFILSGFVLTYTYQGSKASLGEFFRARFARIYPVYLFSLLLAAPLFFKSFLAEGNGGKVPALVAGKLLMIQSWVPWIKESWNEPSWSLSTEAFFYLLFPLLLPLLTLVPARLRWAGSGLLLVGYGFGLVVSNAAGPDVSLSPVRDLALFAAGILIGLQFCDGWRAPKWMFPTCTFGVLGMVALNDPVPTNGWLKVVFTVMLAGSMAGIASIPTQASSILNHPQLKRLGEASYALYILHIPIAEVFGLMASRFGLYLSHPVVLPCYIVLCVWTSVIVFNVIETPANRWLRGRRRSRKPAIVVS